MKAFDEAGRELLPYDWMRGGTNLTFSGTIAFEGTTLSPQAGQFYLELTGENLTQDGQPMGDSQSFIFGQSCIWAVLHDSLYTFTIESRWHVVPSVRDIIAKWFNIHQSEFQHDANCA